MRFFWRGVRVQFLSDEESGNVRRWRHDCHRQSIDRGPLQVIEELRPEGKLRLGNAGTEQPARRDSCRDPSREDAQAGRLESASTAGGAGLSKGACRAA